MTPQQAAAARALLNYSALNGHPHAERCIEPDGWVVDWDAIEQWNWSSGERILVELLRVCVLGHGTVRVQDIYKLDSDNQWAAAFAVGLLFGVQEVAL